MVADLPGAIGNTEIVLWSIFWIVSVLGYWLTTLKRRK
jgi:hypothetical protein